MAGERRENTEDKLVRQDIRSGTPRAGTRRADEPDTRGAGLGEEGSNIGEVDPGVALSGETLEEGSPGLVRPADEGERDVPTSFD
jgi:hypothetical protein